MENDTEEVVRCVDKAIELSQYVVYRDKKSVESALKTLKSLKKKCLNNKEHKIFGG